MEHQILFDPYMLQDQELKNRMVMAPMTRCRSDNSEHAATEMTAEYYAQRATAGLIITEGTFINPMGVGFINVPAIYSNAQVAGWSLVTKAVHDKGGKIFAQLWHVGGVSHPDLLDGALPFSASAINPNAQAYGMTGFLDTVTPKEMTIEEIKSTIADFKKAAANAVAAGFDGVEIHAANGYLIQQFINPNSNCRTDEYGGSKENRARFLFEILEALKEEIDLKKVGIRFNPCAHKFNGMMVTEDTIPTYEYIVNALNNYELAYLHITEPFFPVEGVPYAVLRVAEHFRPLYRGTLMANKGFNKNTANELLRNRTADLVSFGTPFIANPDLVQRLEADMPLNNADQSTFYATGPKGYTDYPVLK